MRETGEFLPHFLLIADVVNQKIDEFC